MFNNIQDDGLNSLRAEFNKIRNTPSASPQASSVEKALFTEKSTSPETAIFEIPTPEKGFAVISGKLLTKEEKPYLTSIYLANPVWSNQENQPPMISFSSDSAPKSIQNKLGDFYFPDVLPGEYILFVWNPLTSFVIKDENTGSPFILEVNPGDVIELGTVYIE